MKTGVDGGTPKAILNVMVKMSLKSFTYNTVKLSIRIMESKMPLLPGPELSKTNSHWYFHLLLL